MTQTTFGTRILRSVTVLVMLFLVLTVRAAVSGVIARTMDHNSDHLRTLVSEIAHDAEQVAAASRHVSSASQSLAQGSSEQAASADRLLQETNTKLNQMVEAMRETNFSSQNISTNLHRGALTSPPQIARQEFPPDGDFKDF